MPPRGPPAREPLVAARGWVHARALPPARRRRPYSGTENRRRPRSTSRASQQSFPPVAPLRASADSAGHHVRAATQGTQVVVVVPRAAWRRCTGLKGRTEGSHFCQFDLSPHLAGSCPSGRYSPELCNFAVEGLPAFFNHSQPRSYLFLGQLRTGAVRVWEHRLIVRTTCRDNHEALPPSRVHCALWHERKLRVEVEDVPAPLVVDTQPRRPSGDAVPPLE